MGRVLQQHINSNENVNKLPSVNGDFFLSSLASFWPNSNLEYCGEKKKKSQIWGIILTWKVIFCHNILWKHTHGWFHNYSIQSYKCQTEDCKSTFIITTCFQSLITFEKLSLELKFLQCNKKKEGMNSWCVKMGVKEWKKLRSKCLLIISSLNRNIYSLWFHLKTSRVGWGHSVTASSPPSEKFMNAVCYQEDRCTFLLNCLLFKQYICIR